MSTVIGRANVVCEQSEISQECLVLQSTNVLVFTGKCSLISFGCVDQLSSLRHAACLISSYGAQQGSTGDGMANTLSAADLIAACSLSSRGCSLQEAQRPTETVSKARLLLGSGIT